jgi:hypothetical protein
VAARGGMALVNVHPDYMNFHRKKRRGEYSADLYVDYLGHAAIHYGQDAWFALPRDVARFYRDHVLSHTAA